MSKLASIVLNWIGGGKTPIPIRFLKSVDIPGNAPNSGNNIHILEITGSLDYTSDEELLKEKLFLDGKPFEYSDINKIHIHNTVVKYLHNNYGISFLSTTNNFISIIAGYDSQYLDAASIIEINLVYYDIEDDEHHNSFRIKFGDI